MPPPGEWLSGCVNAPRLDAARRPADKAAMNAPIAAASPRPQGHPPVLSGRVGVLLVNLGTPEATDYWSMRRYLAEFLSDRRVIEAPRWLWWLILNLFILPRRPAAKGRDYDSVWNRERNEGPLKTFTRSQAEKLALALGGDRRIEVDWAMRYGQPAIAARLAALQAKGCDRILLVPLYPQYCAATTATVADKAFEALQAIAGSRRCASPRRGMTIPPISTRWRSTRARSPGSTSSPRFCSPRSTAFRAPISTRAIPTTAIAPRRHGCCAPRSA